MTRTLMFQNNVPKIYWSDAILCATHLINRLPSSKLENKIPLEILYQRKITFDHLKIFGCTSFVHIKRKDKLDFVSTKTIFLGYSSFKKGYKCYDPINKKLFISRNVIFFENEPYFKKIEIIQEPSQTQIETVNSVTPYIAQNNLEENETNEIEEEIDENNEDINEIEIDNNLELRRSTRIPQPSTRLRDYVTYTVQYPIQNFISYEKILPSYQAFIATIEKEIEPINYQEAINNPVWTKAMEEELKALEKNGTWIIVPLPKNKKPVGCKWVYKIKYNSNGTIERYKARLVAKGFTQTYGIDYNETFAPVAKMNTVRVLISIAVNNNWNLYQMDVKNAFLQGTLEEEVYMALPPGHAKEKYSNLVCRLKKSIYGLKQSPRVWYGKLSQYLNSCNFKISNADHSLFTKIEGKNITIILVYVDDLIITGNNLDSIRKIKLQLKENFDIKGLGYLKYFLGIEIAFSNKGLLLSQRQYALDLLKETGKLGCKPAFTPIDNKYKLNNEDGKPLDNLNQFQRLVGKLIYLTVTRPDISFSVSQISKFMHSPRTPHLEAINRILRYLKGNPGKGIWMKNNNSNVICGYSDADCAGSFDRKSTTGFCTFVGGNLVTWKSKKQNVVARSSAESEYRAMASTASELM